MMYTYHIHIEGQVQGVGFRPFVYKLAIAHGIPGTVSNGVDGVHIRFTSSESLAQVFYQKLLAAPPVRAKVLRHSLQEVAASQFTDFQIIESKKSGRPKLLPTPDLGLCDDCRREIHDPTNRRFGYPFTTCIHCGPRYSILRSLPYDRERTTMLPFKMCPSCQAEYDSPVTRRHFSQTNTCPDCAVELQWWEKAGEGFQQKPGLAPDACISLAISRLAEGGIIAVKGIGGYLLVCDATNPRAVATLRKRKHRPSKPFALMYPNLETLKRDVIVGEAEAAAFLSIESPIVLCRLRAKPASGIAVAEVAPQLDRIGAMQPYTPLFELILAKWGKPIVATSGNLSGSPIFYEDEKARENLGSFVDAFLSNDREILLPQDDSVVQFSPENHQVIMLRRSRGFAPTLIHAGFQGQSSTCLAMGADLKSSFALQHAGNTYTSQYLGDLESLDTQENFEKTLQHLLGLFKTRPQQVVLDKHPAYFSATFGRKLAEEWQVPVLEVQHHVAHFAAVLAENQLLTSEEPILGLTWDGTGWGDDGQIWGGEFFSFENGQFERVAHFQYFPHFLGDKMSREPRLSALALCQGLPQAEAWLRPHFTEKEWALYQKLLVRESGKMDTSSVGRLFDGVAALLGLQAVSSFEGEAAMRLEALAHKFQPSGNRATSYGLPFSEGKIQTKPLLEGVLADLESGIEKEEIAYKFHLCLARLVGQVALFFGIKKIAFSGGVFQNSLLIDLIINELGSEFELYFHKQLSPNDECISFGQLAVAQLQTLAAEHTAFNSSVKKSRLCA
jgi:hydrogenase maturation protein HypF